MTDEHPGASTRASKVIRARPNELYEAFMDPAALVEWLPPGEMTGVIHAFDARVGGGYEMTLSYPPGDSAGRGKTTEQEDRVRVRFVELEPARRIVEAVIFESPDPALHGEMMMEITFHAVDGGTEVSILSTHLPPGLRAEDNEAGSRESLDQLARRFESR